MHGRGLKLRRLSLWGFNTIGPWSDPALWSHAMPYRAILNIATRSGTDWLKGIPVVVYSSRFESHGTGNRGEGVRISCEGS